jgi:DNA polymerase-3 subunit alpha
MDQIIQTNEVNHTQRSCRLKFIIYDEAIILEMPSKSIKISPSNEFLGQITQLSGISYKLN